MDSNAVKANANISNDIELMLMGYHRQPVPTAGSSVKFNVPGTDLLDLVFEVPVKKNIFEISLNFLFSKMMKK